jgi:diadenosine tetraphosphate (Ap4A) HIT family hydrolase
VPPCPICQQVESAHAGTHPRHITTLPHCSVVLHDQQGQRGWCVLQLRSHAEHLADLPVSQQQEIFGEVAAVAAAIRTVTGCTRINYECLGNIAHHIHWHIIPRYPTDENPRAAVWGFQPETLGRTLDPADQTALIAAIRSAIQLQREPR